MTKVLVVLGAVLSVLLAALTMAYAANADAIASSYRGAVAEAASRRASQELAKAESEAAQARLQEQINALERQRGELETELASRQNERARLLADLKTAQAEQVRTQTQVGQLEATARTQAEMIKTISEEVTALRNAQLAASKREIELVDRLNDVESQREVLQQSTRALQEQLAEAQQIVESARTTGGGTVNAGGAATPVESTGPLIRARVLRVFTSPAGKEMAVISEGTSSGIRPNMKMLVIRDGQFLANLVVTPQVDVQQAVVEVDRLGRAVSVREDDLVLSRIQ